MNEVMELGLVIHEVSGLPLELCGAIAQDLVDRGYHKLPEREFEGELYVGGELVEVFRSTSMRNLRSAASLKANKYRKKHGGLGNTDILICRLADGGETRFTREHWTDDDELRDWHTEEQ